MDVSGYGQPRLTVGGVHAAGSISAPVAGDGLWQTAEASMALVGAGWCSVPVRNWDAYLSTMEVTYSGEVAPKAMPLDWHKMAGGLPPPQHCASVDVESLCEGPMLEFVRDPMAELSCRLGVGSSTEAGPVQLLARHGDSNCETLAEARAC